MFKKRLKDILFLINLLSVLFFTGCGLYSGKAMNNEECIPLELGRGVLSSLPEADVYNPQPFEVDLRSYDLTSTDMTGRYEDLIYADFDTLTRWPYYLPKGFEPKILMNMGKNPGLGISSLHDNGITGSGTGIALICSPLLTGHREYAGSLIYYNNDGDEGMTATTSGCLAASIICGKSVGVAPGVSLYCFTSGAVADASADASEKTGFLIKALESVIKLNGLEESDDSEIERKTGKTQKDSEGPEQHDKGLNRSLLIKVICISFDGLEECLSDTRVEMLVEDLIDNGVFIVSTSLYDMYGGRIDFNGLGREPLDSPDDFKAWLPGRAWENSFYGFGRYSQATKTMLVPADRRTVASPTGENDYAYYCTADKSAAAPYIAGLYALASQVVPELTPESFWNAAWDTGEEITVKKNNIRYTLKRIVNPQKMIEKLKTK